MCLKSNGNGCVLVVCEDTESAQEDGNMQLWFAGHNPSGTGFGNTTTYNTFTKYTGSPINEADDENAYKDVAYIFMVGHYYSTSWYNLGCILLRQRADYMDVVILITGS